MISAGSAGTATTSRPATTSAWSVRRDGVGQRPGRARVQAAKVALGERGHAWWEPPTEDSRRRRLEAAVLALARKRAPDKTICPSDAARAVGGEAWRGDMDLAREVVRALAVEGAVAVLQRGEPVAADASWRGPIRVRYSGGRSVPA